MWLLPHHKQLPDTQDWTVHVDVHLMYGGRFPPAGLGGIHLSRGLWKASVGRHCLPRHLRNFQRVEYFYLRPRLAQRTSLLKFSARLGCFSCIIPPPTPTPPPQPLVKFLGFWHAFVGLYLFLPDAVDARICFLLGGIYKHIFLLDRNKEPQMFPKGRKKLPDAGLQM